MLVNHVIGEIVECLIYHERTKPGNHKTDISVCSTAFLFHIQNRINTIRDETDDDNKKNNIIRRISVQILNLLLLLMRRWNFVFPQ